MSLKPRRRSLDWAERWFHDGFAECRPPAFHEAIEVNMTRMRALIEALKERGGKITYTHIFVRAAALALAANPDLHAMICGGKVYHSEQVDIALSVDAETPLAPVLVIRSAESKSLTAIGDEVRSRFPGVQADHRKMIAALQQWGWLVPFSFLRRRLLRLLYRSFEFRRKGSGTFQVSTIAGVDYAATTAFNGSGVLAAGKVRERVIAVDGSAIVCPTVILTCSADHRIWSGMACQRFLLAVQDILEGKQLQSELLSTETGESR